ncbi:MAG: ABC transporter permease [Chloroflexi bacterium]|nr:ABC transporter permease [Chloroflexota bacterium]
MRSAAETQATLERVSLEPQRHFFRDALRRARTKPLGMGGGVIVFFMVVVAVLAPALAPYDPYEIHYGSFLLPPGSQYVLGTDNLGRDILSRLIYGSRISLYVGLLSVILGQIGGGVLGLVSGYFGGKIDAAIQRAMDSLMAFPMLVLALAIVAALGSSINNVVIAIGLTQMPRAARTIRSVAMSVKEAQYVEAARAIGCGDLRILVVHVLPQSLAPFIVLTTMALGFAITVEASLSFLGVGTPPPEPSWGVMMSAEGLEYIERMPWIAILPGISISVAVLGFNLLGDALRDLLDPRLRS